MEEKILNTRKNGMAVLLLTLLGYVVEQYTMPLSLECAIT